MKGTQYEGEIGVEIEASGDKSEKEKTASSTSCISKSERETQKMRKEFPGPSFMRCNFVNVGR